MTKNVYSMSAGGHGEAFVLTKVKKRGSRSSTNRYNDDDSDARCLAARCTGDDVGNACPLN